MRNDKDIINDLATLKRSRHPWDMPSICMQLAADVGPLLDERGDLREAVEDLWACIGTAEIAHLRPETVMLAKGLHEKVWHGIEDDRQLGVDARNAIVRQAVRAHVAANPEHSVAGGNCSDCEWPFK
jgi:hypothetical protein